MLNTLMDRQFSSAPASRAQLGQRGLQAAAGRRQCVCGSVVLRERRCARLPSFQALQCDRTINML